MRGWAKDVEQPVVTKSPPPTWGVILATLVVAAFIGAFAARFGWCLAGRFVP